MRMTVQRKVILDQLRKHKDHPGAETVYGEVRQLLPRISLGTVYRNLDILNSIGVIKRLDVGDDHAHFDPNPHLHPHFVCSRCYKVRDLAWRGGSPPEYDQLVDGLGLSNVEVENIDLTVRGICSECRDSA